MSREPRTLCDIFTAAAETGKPDLLISKVAGAWQPVSARDFGFTVRALSLTSMLPGAVTESVRGVFVKMCRSGSPSSSSVVIVQRVSPS